MERRQGTTVLEVEGVSRHFGGVWALRDVSFVVNEGERVGVIGPNGAGKTTLLNCLMASPPPSRGRIRCKGRSLAGLKPFQIARLGVARSFQLVNVFPSLTVIENLQIALGGQHGGFAFRVDRRFQGKQCLLEEATELARRYGLSGAGGSPAGELSYGQQRRLDLLMALVGHPTLVMLDEPSAGLSSDETMEILQIIQSWPAAAVILIDHDLDIVYRIADRVVVLHEGRVIASGDREEIQGDPAVHDAYFGTVADE